MRTEFERWILSTRKQTQPWSLVERSSDGEGYLDLYTQKQWEGWQAARQAATPAPEPQGVRLDAIKEVIHSYLGSDSLSDCWGEVEPMIQALAASPATVAGAARGRPHGLVNELEREIIRLNKEVHDWIHELNFWRGAWLRHLGGYIVRKHHEIDGFGLRHDQQLKEAEERGAKESAQRLITLLTGLRGLREEWRKQLDAERSVPIRYAIDICIKGLDTLVRTAQGRESL